MALGKGVPDLPYGKNKTTQDMANEYQGMNAVMGGLESPLDLIAGIPEYLQQAPMDALDPYAHGGTELDYGNRPLGPSKEMPIGLGDLAYYGLLAGSMLFGGGKGGLKGTQTNPTVGLRTPTNPLTTNAQNTFAPVQFRGAPQDPRMPGNYTNPMASKAGARDWLANLPPRPSTDPNFLRTYAAHPLEMGAKSMYSGAGGGAGLMGTSMSPQGTLYSGMRAPYAMNEQLRALPAAQQAFARQQIAQHGATYPGGPSFFDRPPTMQVDRTAELAERSKMLNAMSRGGSGAPFPYVSPPRYQKSPAQMAGMYAAPGAGIGLGVLLDQLSQGGLSTLIPGRKLGGKSEYDIMDVAEGAGGGLADIAEWLFNRATQYGDQ